jgi:hypothetical protein
MNGTDQRNTSLHCVTGEIEGLVKRTTAAALSLLQGRACHFGAQISVSRPVVDRRSNLTAPLEVILVSCHPEVYFVNVTTTSLTDGYDMAGRAASSSSERAPLMGKDIVFPSTHSAIVLVCADVRVRRP